jgi:hypothetical protein
MCDQVWDSKFYTPVHFSDESVDRFLVEFILGTGEIWKVRHVIDYRSETALLELLPETLHLFLVEAAELPASRVSGEDLEGIAFFLQCCVYCVVEGFGDGDVDPDSNRNVSLVSPGVADW